MQLLSNYRRSCVFSAVFGKLVAPQRAGARLSLLMGGRRESESEQEGESVRKGWEDEEGWTDPV